MYPFLNKNKLKIMLLVCGLIGLTASFALTLDKIYLLENPGAALSCSLSPIITCSSAMSSDQATTFGIPNSLAGIMLFTALVVVSGATLLGTKFTRRIWAIILGTAILGFLFANYLILQSVLVLHVICPWCFTIWISSPLILLASAKLYATTVPKARASRYGQLFLKAIDNTSAFVVIWYVYLFGLLALTFRDYWVTLF